MKLLPLAEVRSMLRSDAALPWAVRDGGGQLLLAKGHWVEDDDMVEALLARGVFVDADEAAAERSASRPENFLGRWHGLHARLGALLHRPQEAGFEAGVRECAAVLAELGGRNPDLLLFLVLRDAADLRSYGVAHALHVGAVCGLLARALGWRGARRDSLLAAALTMNIAMTDLQGRLAQQAEPLNPAQREAVLDHPAAGFAMLRAAGVADTAWLDAVLQHHEQPGGTGYPRGLGAPCEAAQVLRWVDIYTAMHSARAGRGPLPAREVARELYTAGGGDGIAALVIKAFGIYPPGCCVMLASGETAIVVRRSANAAKPVAMALVNRHGDPMSPLRRDTAQAEHAVIASVPPQSLHVRVAAQQLFETTRA